MEFWMWSWLLTAIGVTGLWLAPRTFWGWAVNLGGQVLWIVYSIVTGQAGFIVGSIAYTVVFGRNFLKGWRDREKAFGVEVLTDDSWDPGGYRYSAEGYAKRHPRMRPGYEFSHQGHRFVVVRTFDCPGAGEDRIRWQAVDRESYVARNTYIPEGESL